MKYAQIKGTSVFLTVDGLRTQKADQRPLCTECGAAVYPSRGFFSHYPSDEKAECPLYRIGTPSFDEAVKHSSTPQEEPRVRAALRHVEIARFNGELFRSLYLRTTRRHLDEKTVAAHLGAAYAAWGSCALLAEHPYLLPYFKIAALTGLERAPASGGGKVAVQWMRKNVQYLLYSRADGTRHQAALPASLQLGFVSFSGKITPMTYSKTMTLPVSLSGAEALSGVKAPLELRGQGGLFQEELARPSKNRPLPVRQGTQELLLPGLQPHLSQSLLQNKYE